MVVEKESNEVFRRMVREFIESNLPQELTVRSGQGFHSGRADQEAWGRILFKKGWSAPAWPKEYGGMDWGAEQQQIFDEECYLAGAPEISWAGIRLVGPVIYTFGSDELRQRFLPKILDWSIFWGQGFSEPDSGSDLASLRTEAEKQGDHYLVNGQKIWMTDGHFADWLFCLVRTNKEVKNQRGISFLLIDAKSEGIEVRPIPSIDNQNTLNEVFFTDVKVPLGNLVGEEGEGWSFAKFLLANERTSSAEIPRLKFYLGRIHELANKISRDGSVIREIDHYSDQIAALEIKLMALEAMVLAVMSQGDVIGKEAAPLSSVLKLRGSQLLQEMSQFMLDIAGEHAVYDASSPEFDCRKVDMSSLVPGITTDYLYRRASTIYGGSAEIQRNIIASSLLSGV